MFLSKRNGIFYLWHEDEKGKRRKVSTRSTNKSDALLFLKKFTPSETSRVTISSFASNLLTMLSQEYVPGTLKIYKKSFLNLIKIAGNIPIRTLTAYHFDKYKSERLKSAKPVTVNIELRTLKAGLGMALEWKMIEVNPFFKIRAGQTCRRIPDLFPATGRQKADWSNQGRLAEGRDSLRCPNRLSIGRNRKPEVERHRF